MAIVVIYPEQKHNFNFRCKKARETWADITEIVSNCCAGRTIFGVRHVWYNTVRKLRETWEIVEIAISAQKDNFRCKKSRGSLQAFVNYLHSSSRRTYFGAICTYTWQIVAYYCSEGYDTFGARKRKEREKSLVYYVIYTYVCTYAKRITFCARKRAKRNISRCDVPSAYIVPAQKAEGHLSVFGAWKREKRDRSLVLIVNNCAKRTKSNFGARKREKRDGSLAISAQKDKFRCKKARWIWQAVVNHGAKGQLSVQYVLV